MPVILQVALDFVDTDRAMGLAADAVAGGADWLEAGTPLIKSEGLDVVRRLHEAFPDHPIVADMKIMDTGRTEMEIAAKAGASHAVVLAAASDATVRECIEAGQSYGIQVIADLIEVADPIARARELQELGVDCVGYHTAIDEQMRGETPFARLRALCEAVRIPVAVAGGINSETAADAAAAGASVVIVGGAITKSTDAAQATRDIKQALETGAKVETALYKRVREEGVRDILSRVPTADVSTGNHDWPSVGTLRQITPGVRLCGPAFTVRTYPGDWSKPVQAIDQASPGDVIVVDEGGLGPAIWGEMATMSAVQRGLAGVVIDGAIRDVAEIRRTKFPAYARLVMPQAGKPKGLGEINVPIMIEGQTVRPGDWVVGDEDGLVFLPRERVVEMANRAMEKLEAEERIMGEIRDAGTSLARVVELQKWDKVK